MLHELLYPSLVLYIYLSVFIHNAQNVQKRNDIHIFSVILTWYHGVNFFFSLPASWLPSTESSFVTPTTTMPTTTSSSSFSPHVFTIPINTKLDDNNYLIWKQQVIGYIKRFETYEVS